MEEDIVRNGLSYSFLGEVSINLTFLFVNVKLSVQFEHINYLDKGGDRNEDGSKKSPGRAFFISRSLVVRGSGLSGGKAACEGCGVWLYGRYTSSSARIAGTTTLLPHLLGKRLG